MKQKKIPYDKAELEIIFFYAEDIVTTSNMEGGGADGDSVDWNTGNDESW